MRLIHLSPVAAATRRGALLYALCGTGALAQDAPAKTDVKEDTLTVTAGAAARRRGMTMWLPASPRWGKSR